MPLDLTRLDPAWSTCDVVYWGAFDPPVALHTATALVPDPNQDSPPTPAPGSPIARPHAPATPTVRPVDPGKPATNTPVPKANPQDPERQDPHPFDPIKTSADDPNLKPQGHDSQSTKVQPLNSQDPNPQDPNSRDPNSQDTNSQDPNTHDPSPPDPPPQIPGEHNADVPNPVTSPNGKHDGDPTGPANPPPSQPFPQNDGVDVNQGEFGKSRDPQTSTNEPAGRTSEEDAGADPSNEHDAASSSKSAGSPNQSPADHTQPLPSIGGHQIQAAGQGGGIIIASTTIPSGVQITIDGTPLSVGKDHIIIIASSTIRLNPQPAKSIVTLVNGDVISAGGQAALASGTTVALAPNNDALIIVNGKTSPIAPPPPISILTIAGQTLTPAPSGFVVQGHSVLPGGSAVTVVGGSTISLASDGNALIVNGKTSPLPPASVAVFRAGSHTFTAAPTGFAIGGQSVRPGGTAVTFAGSTFSLASAGNAVVINGVSTPLPPASMSVFKVGSQVFTATPTGFRIGTQSISPGGSAVTVDGTMVSLGLSQQLVIGTLTIPLRSAAQTYGGASGSLIMNGAGGGASPTSKSSSSSNGSNVAPFLGAGEKLRCDIRTVALTLAVNLGAIFIISELL